jgi:thioredoxin-like negative regulator of GroEL
MKYRLIAVALFLIMLTGLAGQYDEKAILYQQAQQLVQQRQYTQAEQAWLNILQKYPNDVNAVAQLFQMYLQISQPDKAEKLVRDYRAVLPGNVAQEYEIQLDIQQARLDDAWRKTQAYLQLYPGEENKYRLLAGFFERKSFFDYAIMIYQQGRKALNRTDIFLMETGNAAFYSHQYELAVQEYIRFLETQPGNVYFVGNQLNVMLTENPDLIAQFKGIAKNSTSIEVKEVYAISLSRMGSFKEALTEYENLPTEKLTIFANEQYQAGRDSLAIAAYNALRNRQIDLNTLGEIILKTAESQIRLRQFAAAESVLTQLYNPVEKKVNSRFERRRYPFQACLMLADLANWQGRGSGLVISLLNEAKKLATNSEDMAEVNFRLIGNYFVNQQYQEAEQLLKQQGNTKQTDRVFYYRYLLALAAQQTAKADTLLNDLIVAAPSSPFVNDLVTLNILMLNLQANGQKSLLDAYRYRLSHRDSLAVTTVYDLSVTAKDEELRILAADWALASGFSTWADTIYDHTWQDALLSEYTALQRSRLRDNQTRAENMAKDFLKSNPNSVFSPGFRQILQKAPTGRPNL